MSVCEARVEETYLLAPLRTFRLVCGRRMQNDLPPFYINGI